MRLTPVTLLAFSLSVGAMLSGCATLPSTAQVSAAPVVSTEGIAADEAAGRYLEAAEALMTKAQTAVGVAHVRLLLHASEDLVRGGQVAKAKAVVDTLSVVPSMEPGLAARLVFLKTRIALADGDLAAAERALGALPAVPLAPELEARAHSVRAELAKAAGHPVQAVRDLIAREAFLVGPDVHTNHLRIWAILAGIPDAQLVPRAASTSDPVLRGWLELARINDETAPGSAARATALTAWQQAFPHHPAGGAILQSIASVTSGLAPSEITRIAVLLPISSPYQAAAQAVEEGLVAMAKAAPDPGHPTLTLYDIGANPSQVVADYDKALQDGAQAVIGPLGVDAVNTLAAAHAMTVPTLLLGHPATAPAPGTPVVAYGLPPGQEARQVAARAFVDGHRRVVILFPRTAWGRRMVTDFTAAWVALGGTVADAAGYTPGETDYSKPVERVLGVSDSIERHQELETLLNQPLHFESRRRQDIDFVFLIADPADARLIKPQLNFHHADSLPVYATSYVYTGTPDAINDRDLDGIRFCDMPWVLRTNGAMGALRAEVQDSQYVNTPLDRLYALGLDAYRLIPKLAELSADPADTMAGATGTLSIASPGVIHREMTWAVFDKGLPVPLDGSPQAARP